MNRLSSWHRVLAVVILLSIILSFISSEYPSLSRINTTTTTTPKSTIAVQHHAYVKKAHYSNLTILPGELPGFTGWARPTSTLAHYFELDEAVMEPAIVGRNWTVFVTCRHPKGQSGGSLFNVRAYGRSILPGLIQDYRNGTYSITILPFDAGTYQLEVVLAFSNPPLWETLPSENEPGYEGFMLPGFPVEFTVLETSNKNFREPSSRLCTMSEMSETSATSALSTGRWRVKEKMVDHAYQDQSPFTRQNDNLGIRMEYVPTIGCRLMNEAEVQNRETLFEAIHNAKLPTKPIHVVFMGDSNMRLQRTMFNHYFGGISTTHIRTNGGILRKLPEIKEQLNELAKNDENFFLLFNTGLHDVSELCFSSRRFNRDRVINVTDEDFSCVDQYRTSLQEFLGVVNEFPALLTVWQTTTAAWPKWGVWSVAWPAASLQPFPLTTQSCEYFNEIAWDVIISHQNHSIPVMDAYWISVSRPDHREVGSDNSLTGHLVHAGPEIYSVLTRKWAMMILERIQQAER